ncbi:MAG: neutral/alkaline non-lysosomal ceramidase N-terminal domain-containing protein [Planctomycetota bacterium]
MNNIKTWSQDSKGGKNMARKAKFSNGVNVPQPKPQMRSWILLLCLIAAASLTCQRAVERPGATPSPQQEKWKAGVASAVITPEQSMWMAGYAARTKPSEGKVHDLRAKVLALEDAQGTRLVILTVDLIGIPRPLRDWLERQVYRHHKLPPEDLLLNASHTHCGPVIRETKYSIYGDSFYGLSPEQIQQSQHYVEALQQKLLRLVGQAIDKLAPARLGYTHARAGFAMNRRLETEQGYRIRPNPDGPVDHDVPVLRVDSPDGELQAVLFGYACHNTTLNFYKFCGDYAGFAQEYLEEAHPEATALFMSGCGADQNPYPRRGPRSLEYCMQHGRTLANSVEAALLSPARPIRGPIRSVLETVTLDFAQPPSRRQLQQQAESDDKYERRHAQVLLKELEQTGKIRTTYPYLVQAVQFGNDLTIVALAGEVVVDYSLRLKAELAGNAGPPVWVAGYSNDVFGYVPSLRILQEGGYEGGSAMRYTKLPGPFAPSVEKRVVDKVHKLVNKVRAPKSN